jgi:hypothetical protein
MRYRFTRTWCRASVVVGTGVIVLTLLLAAWLALSSDPELERFPSAARILTGLIVGLAGLVVGGTMIVAGQLVSVLLDQRELLVEIHQALTAGASTTVDTAGQP